MKKKNLGDMLVEANLIDEVQMQVALAEQQRTSKKFGSTLVDLKFIDENVLAAFLSKQIDVPCISLLHIDIPKKIIRRITPKLARDCQAIPVRLEDGKLEVAMADPTDIDLVDELEQAVGMPVVPLIAPQSSIEKMIRRFYEEMPDDTAVGRRRDISPSADPIFLDLIEELENGDYDARFQRIEESLNSIWTLLEKILRNQEAMKNEKTAKH